MTSLDPVEIKRVKLHPVKCPKCKLTVMVKPSEKKCPKCKYLLNRPSPEVIDELRIIYRQREHYNRALDRMTAKREREQYAKDLDEVLTQISELLLKQKDYKKWFDGDGVGPPPDWVHEVTGGRPGPDQAK